MEKQYYDNVRNTLNNMTYDFSNFSVDECGWIVAMQDDIASIIGLRNVFLNEVVEFQSITQFSTKKYKGIVMSIQEHLVTVICFDSYQFDFSDTIIKRTGKVLNLVVSPNMLGHTFNGFGMPLTEIVIDNGTLININLTPPTILDIGKNTRQIITSTSIIDIFTPIAYGQRQALIGDSSTGKTTILTNIMKSVKHESNTICIYVSIGQNITNVKLIEQKLRKHNYLSYIMIHVEAGSASIEKYISPFVACAIAEYFKNQKYDVIMFIDDMNSHAWSYQDIVTRMKQPMGKDGLPSDIFYQHALILSMGQVSKHGGTISIIPVVTTIDDDISDYLVTNIMSITDGQIVMSKDVAKSGKYPAININKSVSRIGRTIQNTHFKKLCIETINIMLKYNNLKEMSMLSHDQVHDQSSLDILSIGSKINKILYDGIPKSLITQIISLYMTLNKNIDIDMEKLISITAKYTDNNIDVEKVIQEVITQYEDK